MRSLFPILPVLLLALLSPLRGEEASPPQEDAAPRWHYLGDDRDLRRSIATSGQVLCVCVYQTSLENVNPPFAEVVLSATVVDPLKGDHQTGDKVSIRFLTDSLPKDEGERMKFIAAAAAKNLGALKIAYLRGGKSADYSCEWLDLAPYSPEMLKFVKENRDAKPEPADEKKEDE